MATELSKNFVVTKASDEKRQKRKQAEYDNVMREFSFGCCKDYAANCITGNKFKPIPVCYSTYQQI